MELPRQVMSRLVEIIRQVVEATPAAPYYVETILDLDEMKDNRGHQCIFRERPLANNVLRPGMCLAVHQGLRMFFHCERVYLLPIPYGGTLRGRRTMPLARELALSSAS